MPEDLHSFGIMVWGKSKKAADGEAVRSPGDRKAPDAGLTSCYDFIQYLGSGGSGEELVSVNGCQVLEPSDSISLQVTPLEGTASMMYIEEL